MGFNRDAHRRGRLAVAARQSFALIVAAFLLAACAYLPREPFTAQEQAIAEIPGIPHARFWVDGSDAELREFVRGTALSGAISATGSFDVLALSGGAYDGAYGAGVINGWTATGTRPKFAIVTGVSAGALIAPLAFLGPAYDAPLQEAFAGSAAQFLGDLGGVFSLLGTAEVRRQSLVDLVDAFVDYNLLRAVAAEHAKGRRLFVVTTNLDAQRGVVWDMGAIAAAGPQYRDLFRDVLVASASIPGIFGPTYIEVQANGRRFREMHIDGGATTQVFILPDVVFATGRGISTPKGTPAQLWVIINNRLSPEFEVVESGILSEVPRAFSTLIKASAKGTLYAASSYVEPGRFHLTFIDQGFDDLLKANPGLQPGFNAPYMQTLFRYGYDKARSASPWLASVPLPGNAPKPRPAIASIR